MELALTLQSSLIDNMGTVVKFTHTIVPTLLIQADGTFWCCLWMNLTPVPMLSIKELRNVIHDMLIPFRLKCCLALYSPDPFNCHINSACNEYLSG